MIALLAIPYDVVSLLAEKCFDYRGRQRARKTIRMTLAIGNFCAGFVLGALVPAALIVAVVLSIDAKISHSDLTPPALVEAIPPVGSGEPSSEASVATVHQNVSQIVSGSADSAIMTTPPAAWKAVSLVVVIGFACVAVIVRLTSHGYGLALANTVIGAAGKNRQKTSHYLKNTAQQRPHR